MTWERRGEGKKNQGSHCTSFVGSLEEEVNGVQRKNRHERQENSEKRERHPVINKHSFALMKHFLSDTALLRLPLLTRD